MLNLEVMIKTNSSSDIAELTRHIENYAAVNLPKNLTITFSGTAHLNTAATNEIVQGQVNSFVISLVITYLLLVLTFRSTITGLFGIIPLLVTILLNFGLMGFSGLTLNIGTAIISSIVIGVGVDYSIHYLSRLQVNLRAGLPFAEAILETVRFSGKAIVANALTVAIGFVALLFSSVTPMITAGWMIILTMLISSFSTIVLLPTFLSVFQRITVAKWSTQPATEIPGKPNAIQS